MWKGPFHHISLLKKFTQHWLCWIQLIFERYQRKRFFVYWRNTQQIQHKRTICSTYQAEMVCFSNIYICNVSTGADSYRKIFMETSNPPDLLNLLTEFSTCCPPLEVLLEHLPPLKPRYYSGSNSILHHPNQIHIAFNVVEYEIMRSPWKQFLPSASDNKEPSDTLYSEESKQNISPQRRLGLCTSWLDQLSQAVHASNNNNATIELKIKEVYVPIFKKPSNDFKLPSMFESEKEEEIPPVIMVGAGTGVAPFRSFLQHIHSLK